MQPKRFAQSLKPASNQPQQEPASDHQNTLRPPPKPAEGQGNLRSSSIPGWEKVHSDLLTNSFSYRLPGKIGFTKHVDPTGSILDKLLELVQWEDVWSYNQQNGYFKSRGTQW